MSHLKAAYTASKESTAIVQPRSMSASTTPQITSLHEATKWEQYDIFDKLINIPDVDPNELDREGRTPLIRIVQEGCPEFYLQRIFQRTSTDIDARDGEHGMTALMHSIVKANWSSFTTFWRWELTQQSEITGIEKPWLSPSSTEETTLWIHWSNLKPCRVYVARKPC